MLRLATYADLAIFTCEEYCITLWDQGFFDPIHSEMHLTDSFNALKIFERVLNKAECDQVTLTDKDAFDYEPFFWEQYCDDREKSLR